ncbi:MAG: DUF4177 domain-containing protein [Phycisphaerales bacterium JB063]
MIWHYSTRIIDTSTFFSRGRIDQPELNAILKSYGELGWELVSITPIEQNAHGTYSLLLTFKQPGQSPTEDNG